MPNILIFKYRNRISGWFAPAKRWFAPAKRWFAATIRSFAAAKRKRDQAGERENAAFIGYNCELLTSRAEFEATETDGRESKGEIKSGGRLSRRQLPADMGFIIMMRPAKCVGSVAYWSSFFT
ncbi:hypothetical protein [Alloprevotella tannerae]|uniref:hypothetical protein n=1 Tax=Alloprevotella tannerae TaxID=76122 RepID=UPI00241D25EF|nr:hypothetical protein [Alloprevotella tannerae]